jgi:hypothetical protein
VAVPHSRLEAEEVEASCRTGRASDETEARVRDGASEGASGDEDVGQHEDACVEVHPA